MKEFTVTVQDPVGIHARPAGLLVKETQNLKSDVRIVCREKEADGKRLFAVMSLGAKHGDTLTVTVTGEHEEEEARNLRAFMEKHL